MTVFYFKNDFGSHALFALCAQSPYFSPRPKSEYVNTLRSSQTDSSHVSSPQSSLLQTFLLWMRSTGKVRLKIVKKEWMVKTAQI